MKIAYGDLIGGVSGDMFVAALLDLGLPLDRLRAALKKLPNLRFEIRSRKKIVH
ncbi:MAG TPA: nickel insertion protein, partial [Candidatus Binatia bacterium]